MINIVLYLLVSYLGVLLVIVAVARWGRRLWRNNATRKRRVLIPLAAVLLALPPVPYAVVETRTYLFARTVLQPTRAAMREIGYEDRIRDLKVLAISKDKASVYVVTPCFATGSDYIACVIQLDKTRNGWRYRKDSEEAIWSDCGSAHGNIFPPYPSQGDYH